MSVPERRNGKPSVTEYTVSPVRAEIAHRWLKVTRKASESATMSGSAVLKLPLGHTHHEDAGPLHIISGALEYQPGGKYEISAYMVDGSCDEMRQGALGAVLGLGGGRVRVMDADRRRTWDSGLPGIDAVARNLRTRLTGDYELAGPEKDEVFITSGDLFTDAEPLVVRSVESQDGQNAYAVELKKGIEEDPAEFAKRFNATGRVLQELVRAVYDEKRRPSPAEILELGPEEGTEEGVRRLEQQLEISRRQMAAMGFIDGGDEEEIRREIMLSREAIPNVTFADIGGQERAKIELEDVVLGTKDPEAFRSQGTYPPKGVLLYGPKGTGKTLLARAVARAAEATFFNVDIASMVHGLLGKSEKYMQELFKQARAEAPSIIFFDELDSIARSRSASDRFSSNLVTILLTNMDGLKDSDDGVTVIGATNFLQLIDDALLRPKRFGVRIPVELPNLQARTDILDIKVREALGRSEKPFDQLFDSAFSTAEIAKRTDKYSGADLEELVRLSLLTRVRSIARGETPELITTATMLARSRDYDQVRQDMNKRNQMGFTAEMSRRDASRADQ